MSKPCKGCDEEDQRLVYSDGKMHMRFIRANKKPRGAMQNYEDGKLYWMKPRYAVLPWWEPVDEFQMPIVEEATEEESVYAVTELGDMNSSASLGPSGISVGPRGVIGAFREPEQVVIDELEDIAPQLEAPVEEKTEEPENLGFPQGASPSRKWRKAELLQFVKSKGGLANMSMKKDLLLTVALSLV